MNDTGTGWVEDASYTIHANVKLTLEQKEAIAASGESESQWIREAVESRLELERGIHNPLRKTDTPAEIDRAILYLKLKKRMYELTGQEPEPVKVTVPEKTLTVHEEALGLGDMGEKPLTDEEKRVILRKRMDEVMETHRHE